MKIDSVYSIVEKHRIKKNWTKGELTARLNCAGTARIFYPEMWSRFPPISLQQLRAIQTVTKIKFLN
jgi:hypothetical protein